MQQSSPRGLDEKLQAYVGEPAASEAYGPDPVNEPMIRHWCEAMGDTNPVYTDPVAAEATRFGGLIAPPAMLQAWTMAGLSGPRGTRTGAYDELLGLLDDEGFSAVVATNCEQEYLRPLRPGERIRFDAVIESVSSRKRTALGAGHFVTTCMNVRVGAELVGTHRFRILKYRPEQRKEKRPQREKEQQAGRPRPVINRDNEGFWAGVAEHKLLVQRCRDCDTLRFPWLPGCNACGSMEWEAVEAAGTGVVYSFVVMHHPPFPAFDPPYAVALIELTEGVRIVSNVVGVPHDEVRIGMPVAVEFRGYGDELTLPVFGPSEPEKAR
ncbi:bifunctional MaoC family dehydratase N-terminal/OB-fold nucleic acid binding domain-containing protein [Wenjunlia tyrosinilytica]|nr:bifunctional MaoC family dehydratase N-terminal/OB-fold nucleic acid binding domain-containing protein [Wenjunlia tyrosinilytica]